MVTKVTTLAQLDKVAALMVASGERLIAEFQEKLARNPRYAFEWSGNAFLGAGRVEVGKIVETMVETMVTRREIDDPESTEAELLARILDRAKDEAMRGMGRPTSRSTSVTSNLTEDCVRAAWLHVVQKLTGQLTDF